MVDGTPVLLAKPQTYMNLSGESVGTAPLLKIFSNTGLCYLNAMQFVSLADFTLQ
jgi:peptidyl-tRNA hydrolase